MQTELLTVISKTSQYILDFGTAQLPLTQTSFGELLTVESEISKKSKLEAQSAQPLVELISLLLTQWRIIAERHEILLEILKYSNKKYNTPGISLYTMTHYWSRVQAVVWLFLNSNNLSVHLYIINPFCIIFLASTIVDGLFRYTKPKIGISTNGLS